MKINTIIILASIAVVFGCKYEKANDGKLKVIIEVIPEHCSDSCYEISWKDTLGTKDGYNFNTRNFLHRPIELWCIIKDSSNDTIGFYGGLSFPRTHTAFFTSDSIVTIEFAKAPNFNSELYYADEKEGEKLWEKNKKPVPYKAVQLNLKTQLRDIIEVELEENLNR